MQKKNNESLLDKIKDELAPGLISGAIAAIGANALLGVEFSSRYPLFGYNVPSYLAIGSVVAASQITAEVLHDQVLESLPDSIKGSWLNYENRLLAPILGGAATFGLFKLGVSNDVEFLNSALLGGVSSIAGKYAYMTIEGQ
jgi:hypothetical protein